MVLAKKKEPQLTVVFILCHDWMRKAGLKRKINCSHMVSVQPREKGFACLNRRRNWKDVRQSGSWRPPSLAFQFILSKNRRRSLLFDCNLNWRIFFCFPHPFHHSVCISFYKWEQISYSAMTYLNGLGAHRLRIRTYVRCYQKILGGCGSKVLSIHYKLKRKTYLPGSSS